MLLQLVAALQRIDPDITAKDIAETLWLASRMKKSAKPPTVKETSSEGASGLDLQPPTSAEAVQPVIGMYTGSSQKDTAQSQQQGAMPFKSPAASALPGSRDIARSLRPLKQQASLPTKTILNEVATAQRIAEERLWVPVLDNASTRWLDVVLVVDRGASMAVWQQTIADFYRLLARYGAFRDVRIWDMDTNNPDTVQFYVRARKRVERRRISSSREIIDISGRRLILVMTDCVSEAWHSGAVVDTFATWGRYNPVTLVQLLPQRLWSRTALGMVMPVRLHTSSPGAPNSRFRVQKTRFWDEETERSNIVVPIITLEPKPLAAWSQAIGRAANLWIPGFELVIPAQEQEDQWSDIHALHREAIPIPLSAAERVQRFRANASPLARRLVELLAVVPISLPVIRLVQLTMLSEARQVHVAEVFLSGLLQVVSLNIDADSVQYDFVDGVRELLLDVVSPHDSYRLLTEISAFITNNFGVAFDFGTLLANPLARDGSKVFIDASIRPFALMGANALRRFGGDYIALADWLEEKAGTMGPAQGTSQRRDEYGTLQERSPDVLLQGPKTTMRYANARVVLVGDSGVGKTGLFRALSGQIFRPTESTHALHIFLLENDVVPLNFLGEYDEKGMLSERRETLLWDLAGQPGYRVVHQLHLNEVTLALVVFDGRNETDPFAGVYHWDRALRQAKNVLGQAALPVKKLLVAARVDRGGIAVSRERIDELVQDLGFVGYIETSAKEGYHIDKLRETIKEAIEWDALPTVTSNELFETIKNFLLERKQTGHILTRIPDLYSLLLTSHKIGPHSEELQAQFERCIALVESRGLIKRFRFGSFLLLQPELLDAYASALMNSVRDEPDGLGSILEAQAKSCGFRMPSDERIPDQEQEKLLLLAMIEDMLHHEMALLEGNYLVFPSQSTRVNHELPDPPGKTLLFEFEGPVQNIYTTLTVRLSRSELFKKKDLWKDAITYTARVGGQCGLFLQSTGEGSGRLTLFFSPQATEETRFHFEDYVEKHLQRWAIPGSVQRSRLFTCPSCGEPILHNTVLKRRARGFDWLLCSICETRIDLADREERLSSTPSSRTLEMDLAADSRRKLDILRSTRRKEVEVSRGQKMGDYDLFLCYSVGDRRTIKQIGDQLLDMNILPWLDEWEVPPGQDWRRVLSAQMASINAATVFVGKDTPVPWDDPQTNQLLRTFAKKHIVIPVLLPECVRFSQLPSYIKEPWVDMRVSEPDPIRSLVEWIMSK